MNVFYRYGRAAKPGDVCVGCWTETDADMKVAATVVVVQVLEKSKNMVVFVYVTGKPTSTSQHFCICDAYELIHIDDVFQESKLQGWKKV